MTTSELSEIRKRVGSLGGLSTCRKYGEQYLRDLGKTGGRPRNHTLIEYRLREQKLKEERLPTGNSLATLKALFRQQIKEGLGSLPGNSARKELVHA